ncbi:MAG: beta-ketoacyl-ACP synthase III [Bacteroidota bacterium]|nr:beta-ketoacyl-ACP synthase III [Bacteroidota bacterium]MDP4216217.1 beta-ketoacyl-ACP synthase III [Bacteroidota bacterium]MDP4245124.1 beta-ketoacyl-ACP synthase III [Bacteroidota bacterium]MDP4253342.1 beta-ketoacyl-ACP synthase III [Bacteroidota bacterium]MDP4256785.1 beta-ketoacyl-ACP synthase III [Bacteroidota bacterium]
MPLSEVYITNTSAFLPNDPVSNDEMETYLGYINGKPSKSRKIVLRNNGIKIRYYALTKEGKPTHTNAQMTALAVKGLFLRDPNKIKALDLLSCGTSSPDQMMPSHGVMTHGWLPEANAIEVVSPSGVCCAGMHAFKYAYLAIRTGDAMLAVATGSERFSGSLVSHVFEEETHKLAELQKNPFIGFEKEFLRWMLSDGAAAFLMSDKKNDSGLSLRVDWIEGVSYANEMEACMYMASEKMPDGTLKSYMDFTPEEIISRSILSIKQDVKLLSDNIVPLGGKRIKEIFEKRGLEPEDVDYFLPHISSEYFKSKIFDIMESYGKGIPYERWFINLASVGNVGAASAYLMVHELYHSGKLKKGEKMLLLVPESGRFSYMYAMLTVC